MRVLVHTDFSPSVTGGREVVSMSLKFWSLGLVIYKMEIIKIYPPSLFVLRIT